MANKLFTVASEDKGVVVTISLSDECVQAGINGYPSGDLPLEALEKDLGKVAELLSVALGATMQLSDGARVAYYLGRIAMHLKTTGSGIPHS